MGLNDGLAPTDPVAPPMSVGRAQSNEPTEAERLAHNRTYIPFADWCESCVRGRGPDDPHRARQDQDEGNPIPVVQCDYFFFKAEKEDIMCKAISAIDSENNRAVPKRPKEFSRLRCEQFQFASADMQGVPTSPLGRGSACGVWLNTESFVAFVQVAKVMGRHSVVLILLVNQIESGRETGRSVLEQGRDALFLRVPLQITSRTSF